MMNILSLGAGVQSTALLLMSIKGVLPRIDHAIFADTKWEPPAVYEHLTWLEGEAAKAGIALHRVDGGDLRSDALRSQGRGKKVDGQRWASMPLRVLQDDGSEGMIRRQCTAEYKIQPIERFIRSEILGLKKRQRWPKDHQIDQWFGISADEAQRAKPPQRACTRNVYPLLNLTIDHDGTPGDVEYLPRMFRREHCLRWLAEHYPDRTIPRSACIGCPFHSDHEWRQIKAEPDEWADAVEFDNAIRHACGTRGRLYLHRTCTPLEDVNLDTAEEQGQGSLFGQECEGVCGV